MNPKSSSRSVPPRKSGKSNPESEEDFETCLMELYKRFNSPVPVTVYKEYSQCDTKTQKPRELKTKYKRVTVTNVATVASSASQSIVAIKDDGYTEEITLPITAIYDTHTRLSAILMEKFQEEIIPRVTIQLLALILPNYQQLSKFTIKNCRIDTYVIHELSKMLPYTSLTDLCLDDCPLDQSNYEELLENTTYLKNLSLCRCNIKEAECERIASALHYLESAEQNLVTLNLTSNCIGDEGAKYLAEALRSNRHLRYLNLSDNRISDEGASLIFNSLSEFPLTYDENMNRRKRYMVYLKKKVEIYKECLHKLGLSQTSPPGSIHSNKTHSLHKVHELPKRASHPHVKRESIKRQSAKTLSLTALTEDDLPKKAELIARELLGPFVDPFCPNSIRIKDYPRCIGNFVLCYLNLAYNDLTYASVSKLLSVIEYQRQLDTTKNKADACGLMKVVLDGNHLPIACTELVTIQKMLNQHIASFQSNKRNWL